jgi:hypothetical protein
LLAVSHLTLPPSGHGPRSLSRHDLRALRCQQPSRSHRLGSSVMGCRSGGLQLALSAACRPPNFVLRQVPLPPIVANRQSGTLPMGLNAIADRRRRIGSQRSIDFDGISYIGRYYCPRANLCLPFATKRLNLCGTRTTRFRACHFLLLRLLRAPPRALESSSRRAICPLKRNSIASLKLVLPWLLPPQKTEIDSGRSGVWRAVPKLLKPCTSILVS